MVTQRRKLSRSAPSVVAAWSRLGATINSRGRGCSARSDSSYWPSTCWAMKPVTSPTSAAMVTPAPARSAPANGPAASKRCSIRPATGSSRSDSVARLASAHSPRPTTSTGGTGPSGVRPVCAPTGASSSRASAGRSTPRSGISAGARGEARDLAGHAPVDHRSGSSWRVSSTPANRSPCSSIRSSTSLDSNTRSPAPPPAPWSTSSQLRGVDTVGRGRARRE